MRLRVLGAGAGGGFPQWNCSCSNCRRLRQGTLKAEPRSQAQLAVTADGQHWFLINASPDLRSQIESFPELHPRATTIRNSPIRGIILTSAELDAALGLLLLRESQPISVYATESVRRLLMEDNDVFRVLQRLPDQVRWHTLVPGKKVELDDAGLCCTPVSSGGGFPGHVPPERAAAFDPAEAVIGLFLEHRNRQVAFLPGAPAVQQEWFQRISGCEAVLFDGTFWSEEELIRTQGHGKLAREMGHSPMSGPGGTMQHFAGVHGPRKIFIHINNTNPVLDGEGPENSEMRAAGWELAYDGMDLAY
jgi:pyrroloquinoline quinone biosynthesis protein B